jgi:hypothetical protein
MQAPRRTRATRHEKQSPNDDGGCYRTQARAHEARPRKETKYAQWERPLRQARARGR